jgi:diguanylate cyclase (GGDEF)-like protein
VSRKVLCFDDDPVRLARVGEAVREAGAEPVEAGRLAVHRLARAAHVVVAGGEEGVELLARLALDRPSLPRIAVVEAGLLPEGVLGVVERAHPWAIVTDPLEGGRLVAALRDALASVAEGHTTELTQRVQRPTHAPPDFEKLISDGLTGAEGYHYMRLRLEEELERSSRYSRPLSLVLIDLDDLRGLNDRYGRAAGDHALKQIASTLISGARAVDRVGRWAGGGFALVLPETPAGAAYGLAERLRADISARVFQPTAPSGIEPQRPLPKLRVTVSCGVASTMREGVSRPASLLQRTDAALWRAKQGGRNRCVIDG